jgi:dsDNA-specific endonuclease/ATPase MutS2
MTEQKIKGISIKHIERIIDIIRNRYSIVKKGTKYLETVERKFDLTALANIRDFISHIETAFNINASEMEREESIIQSEEHLRRALV